MKENVSILHGTDTNDMQDISQGIYDIILLIQVNKMIP